MSPYFRHRASLSGFLFAGMLSLLWNSTVNAQKKPFSELEFRSIAVMNLDNGEDFHQYWKPGTGVGFSVKTPFYAGNAELGLHYHAYDSYNLGVPPMVGFQAFVGWGYPLTLGPISFEPGIRAGNYRMIFDDASTAFRSESDESEFSGTLLLGAELRATQWLLLNLEASPTAVMTYNRLYLYYIGAGVSVRIKTGARLQEVLTQ